MKWKENEEAYGYARNSHLQNDHVKALHGQSQWDTPGKHYKETLH